MITIWKGKKQWQYAALRWVAMDNHGFYIKAHKQWRYWSIAICLPFMHFSKSNNYYEFGLLYWLTGFSIRIQH